MVVEQSIFQLKERHLLYRCTEVSRGGVVTELVDDDARRRRDGYDITEEVHDFLEPWLFTTRHVKTLHPILPKSSDEDYIGLVRIASGADFSANSLELSYVNPCGRPECTPPKVMPSP